MMKQRSDRFFAEGINNTLLHVYISQPDDREPGINAWFSNEFNRHNTWFSQMDVFTAYLKRVNFMLQQGLNVADAAYFIGEDAPKMTGVTDPALPAGYQFDYMNAEVIEKYRPYRTARSRCRTVRNTAYWCFRNSKRCVPNCSRRSSS